MNTITYYMSRAGIASRRELSRLTGIAHSTLDEICKHPGTARGYQLAAIAEACGMSNAETGELVTGGGK